MPKGLGPGRAGWVAGGLAAALAVVAFMVWWPASRAAAPVPPVRARTYTQVRTCLLTGDRGLADTRAGAAWAGLQDASARTRAQVRYLAVTGAQNAGNAALHLASLAVQGCSLIVAVGPAPAAAVGLDHARFPRVRFAVTTGGAEGANVRTLPGTASRLRSAVSATALAAAVN